jgi:hypothetical protein
VVVNAVTVALLVLFMLDRFAKILTKPTRDVDDETFWLLITLTPDQKRSKPVL